MSRAKLFSFTTDTGTLLFPNGDVAVAGPGEALSPTGSSLRTAISMVGDQLARLPEVAAAASRGVSVAAVADPEALPVSEGALTRPNGEVYVPRFITAGATRMEDVQFVKRCYKERIPLLMTGPPGTGKTALAEVSLPNLVTLPGSGDTEWSDFIGSYVQNPDGTFTWVDGPLIVAMENGWPLLIDEIALIDPREMAGAYSVMDGRNELTVTANPARGTVKVTEGFYIIGACNPDVPGAVMSEALTSRFLVQLEVETDYDLAVKLGVPREIVVTAKNLKRKKDETSAVMSVPQMRELLGFKKILEVFGVEAALANFIGKAEPGDRDTYIEVVKSNFAQEIKPLTIG